jgi:pyruvate/2-oxoglutarate/acetoin dehydrogenase E1 component/TPP-dependent pyruvate/acetoin dehydrogenase alpha subunit
MGFLSRQASIVGRREVLSGKAKFGIFGDGKELAQLALARACRKGDWRSGYYRDQTWLFALEVINLRNYFAQLYADTDVDREPQTGGRSMNGHFASRLLADDGSWLDQTASFNSAADLSPTASQLPKAVGLAYASVLYRKLAGSGGLDSTGFSRGGGEVAWATIGNASTAEGLFWESVNAIGVLGAPAVITVYDDGYGISVPNQFQMVKENISSILEGFRRYACPADQCERGFDLHSAPGWDYPALLSVYAQAGANARADHIPAIIHVTDCTQPLGHSSSGSHERYKSPERLEWEREFDCLVKFRQWLVDNGNASAAELDGLEVEAISMVEEARIAAFEACHSPIRQERKQAHSLILAAAQATRSDNGYGTGIRQTAEELAAIDEPSRRDIAAAVHRSLVLSRGASGTQRDALLAFLKGMRTENGRRYGSHLHSESAESALRIPLRPPEYTPDSPSVMGFELINAAFDAAFTRDRRIIAFGEDVGQLGDVNQGFRGLQEKYGPWRITDTGIREATIVGQAIGMALRGLRPIAEIQYLDYLLYALQLLSDDLASLHWRTAGGQKAPVVIRTRGHRLEGIWHAGSPMAGILHLVRGLNVLVPRNFTQAAGFYNTLLRSDESGIVVEVLNAYRLRERLPSNLGEMTLPLGVCEILRPGSDLTLVTYGAMTRIAMEAAELLSTVGADLEVIDVQSLLPFDIPGDITASIQKTSRVLFVDEDVPGGTTGYMMREVLERQGAYELLDSPPRTLSAASHRPAYGSDGDYWSKPNAQTIFDAAYDLMREAMPSRFKALY